jgi:hypothetical protein
MGLALFKIVAGIVDAGPRRSKPANNADERESIGTEGNQENKE